MRSIRIIRIRTLLLLLVIAASLTVLPGFSSCDPPVLDNAGFDLWCGDELCGWEVEAGAVRRVPTWHERDFGVELLGQTAIISQLVDLTQQDASCFHFDLLADADEGVDLELELDFLDDGEPELVQPLPAENWQSLHYDLTPPEWYSGVRFRLRKHGDGRAVLAQIWVTRGEAGDCQAPPIELAHRPAGAPCGHASDCAGAACVWTDLLAMPGWPAGERVCGSCEHDGDCSAGQVCGSVETRQGWRATGCVEAGVRELGEICRVHDECRSGICCEQQCAECCPGSFPCEALQLCARLPSMDGKDHERIAPYCCDPEQSLRGAGEPCLRGADCASGSCLGAEHLKLCDPEGYRCETIDDCPWNPFTVCVEVGMLDGICR